MMSMMSSSLCCIVTEFWSECDVIQCFVSKHATGHELLNKVCDVLGLVERDYFGLSYTGPDGRVWLNLRNSIRLQVGEHAREPYTFELRVKFFVNPSQLLQDRTRSRFYHDLKRHLRTGKFRFSDSNSLARLVALASHTDFGFGSNPNRGATHRCYCMEGEWSESLETAVTLQRIRISQYTRQEAINEFLKIIADHPAYGVETHTLDANKNNERIAIELGMRDLYFVNRKGQTERGFPLKEVTFATANGKQINVAYQVEDGKLRKESFYLRSNESAANLERAITERHIFYHRLKVNFTETPRFASCVDTIGSKLYSQWKSHRRIYKYDVTRTSREAFFVYWDKLYQQRQYSVTQFNDFDDIYISEEHLALNRNTSPLTSHSHTHRERSNSMETNSMNLGSSTDLTSSSESIDQPVSMSRSNLECKVCMARMLDTVFCPCGHAVCCRSCALRCKSCPICRAHVHLLQQLYLPIM